MAGVAELFVSIGNNLSFGITIYSWYEFKFSKLLHSKFACNNLVLEAVEIALCVNAWQ